MSYEKIPLGNNVQGMTTSPIFDKYSKVTVKNGDVSYTAGNDNGRTLEVECPYATQEMANTILSQVEGFAYQPYEATSAYLDPAAEMGDGINAKSVYSGVYKYTIDFNRIMPWDLSADSDEELEHEFGFIGDDGKYVTYSGLISGNVAVNGAGLMSNSVENASIATNAILNRNIASGQIFESTCNQTINDYFADVIAANKIFAGTAYAKFMMAEKFGVHNGSTAGSIVARTLWVDSSGVVHATP